MENRSKLKHRGGGGGEGGRLQLQVARKAQKKIGQNLSSLILTKIKIFANARKIGFRFFRF